MRVLVSLLFAAALAAPAQAPRQSPAGSATEQMYRAAAASAARKLEHIRANAAKAHPDQTPTVLTEREVNAYLDSRAGYVDLPNGVRSVQFTGTPGVIRATTVVDFDRITQQRGTQNPLMALFTGVHDVHVTAHAYAAGGQAQIHTDAVDIDGIPVPRMALQYFLDKYVRPKHPEVSLDTTFKLAYKIDIAQVGEHQLTITQK